MWGVRLFGCPGMKAARKYFRESERKTARQPSNRVKGGERMENDRQERFTRLVEAHGDRLYRLCLLLLSDPHLAEDAVQDTMLKAWRGLDNIEARASEKTWLTTIAVNVCRDYRRLCWYRRRLDGGELLEQIPAPPDAEPQDDEILRQVLALAPKYREPVLLYYWQQLTIPEIAALLHEKENTVSTRLRRARAQLKQTLKGWDDDG